ncbi:hypothetical protein L0F63_002927 [Massospora cicadina]|nr:hypothetical protein L0F63_002927 [Massospora cicadina]
MDPYQSALEDENFELAEFLKNFTNNAKQLQSKNNLSHVDYDGNADYKDHPEVDLNAPFLAQFEEVLKDSTFESEEKRDEKLNDLVLNLLHSHAKSRTTSTPKDF